MRGENKTLQNEPLWLWICVNEAFGLGDRITDVADEWDIVPLCKAADAESRRGKSCSGRFPLALIEVQLEWRAGAVLVVATMKDIQQIKWAEAVKGLEGLDRF